MTAPKPAAAEVAAPVDRVTVLVADDHPVYRDGMASIFEQRAELDLVGQAASGEEALVEIRRTAPDVAVIDLQLPSIDGIEVIEALEREQVPTKCVIISAYQDSATVYRAIAAGARAYVLKIASGEALCETVLAVAAGGTVIPPDLQTGLAEELRRRRDATREPKLTARETEILRLAAEGRSVREIAADLFVGVTTVKTHLQHIYEKLGVTDRAAAVAQGMRLGLVT